MIRPLRAPAAAVSVVALLTATAGSALSVPAAAAAGSACTADFRIVGQWSGAFQAEIEVRNTATAPLTGWRLSWSFANGERISQAWNAAVVQNGPTVTATHAVFNGALSPGSWTTVGLLAAGAPGAASPAVTCTDPAEPTDSPTPPAPSDSPDACGSAGFCDGFETQDGTTPAGVWAVDRPNCGGSGTATVDSTVAHSGGRSVRIDGRAGYCNHVFVRPAADLGALGPNWHVRLYVRHSSPLPGGHVAFVALRDDADGGKDLRLGGQNGALQWNRESDDATVPIQSPAGVARSRPLPTGTWTCVAFTVDGSHGTMSTSIDGEQVAGLLVDGAPTTEVDQQWSSRSWRPALTDLRLGWESYGGGDDTLWFDDVAISADPLGC